MEHVIALPKVNIDERPNWLLEPNRDRNLAITLSVMRDAFISNVSDLRSHMLTFINIPINFH